MSNVDGNDQFEYEYVAEEPTTVVGSGINPIEPDIDPYIPKSVEELRSSPRKQYPVRQRIAPMHGDLFPQVDEYFNVECNDISQGGISFFLKRPPGCEHFAIALGQRPRITVLIGRVAYARIVEHDGDQMYLVGCQFINRLAVKNADRI
jgi:hypothetical protein